MQRLSVTFVDVLGVFVPGLLFVSGIGLVVFYFPLNLRTGIPLPEGGLAAVLNTEAVRQNIWLFSLLVGVVSYVSGFLLRLVSIPLLHHLTWRRWTGPLAERVGGAMSVAMESAMNNEKIRVALISLSTQGGKRDLARHAPYFSFGKRIVRQNPHLWVEAERLESEVRFAAGLFLPFVLLVLVGLLMAWSGVTVGWFVSFLSLVAAGVVLLEFPTRRIREVQYIYFLTLVALNYPLAGLEIGRAGSDVLGRSEPKPPESGR